MFLTLLNDSNVDEFHMNYRYHRNLNISNNFHANVLHRKQIQSKKQNKFRKLNFQRNVSVAKKLELRIRKENVRDINLCNHENIFSHSHRL